MKRKRKRTWQGERVVTEKERESDRERKRERKKEKNRE